MTDAVQHEVLRILKSINFSLVEPVRGRIETTITTLTKPLSTLPLAQLTHLMLKNVREIEAILKKRRSIDPDEFIAEMEGFIKEDFSLPVIDPLGLKKIWVKGGEHDIC